MRSWGRLLEELQGYDRFVVEFLASTGLRFSEALGLRWDKVDLEGRRLAIVVRRRENDLGPTKTRNSTRIVPISAQTAQGLAELRAERGGADTDFVFRTLTGTPLKTNNFFNRAFKPAARGAGVEWANIKTLRHTCATRLLRRGATAAQVSRWPRRVPPTMLAGAIAVRRPGAAPLGSMIIGIAGPVPGSVP